MKRINLLALFAFFAAYAFGQVEMESGQYQGYITTKDGKQEGIIWLKGAEDAPWLRQKEVYFLTDDEFSKLTKNKRKYFNEYKSKEILGYGYNKHHFESVKYADMSAVGTDMIAKMYFLEVLVSGKMGVYKYYKTPPSVLSGDDINKTNDEWAKDNDIVIQKEGEKSKTAESVELTTWLEDCPAVKDKYLSGGYGFEPKNDGSKGGLKKVFAKMSDRSKLEDAIITIAKEYNECK